MRILPIIALLLALAGNVHAAVQAPELVLTGTFTVDVTHDAGIQDAVLTVDGEPVARRLNVSSPRLVLEVPVLDGLHNYQLTVQGTDGQARTFSGSFNAQNLAPVIAAAVAQQGRNEELEQLVQAGIDAAERAAMEARNATVAAKAIDAATLARQGDLERFAADMAGQFAAAEARQEAGENATASRLRHVERDLEAVQGSFAFLCVLVLLALALLLFIGVRLGRPSGFDDSDRVLVRALAVHVGLSPDSPAVQQAVASLQRTRPAPAPTSPPAPAPPDEDAMRQRRRQRRLAQDRGQAS